MTDSHTNEIVKRVEAMRKTMDLPNTVGAVEDMVEGQGAGNGTFEKRGGGDDNG